MFVFIASVEGLTSGSDATCNSFEFHFSLIIPLHSPFSILKQLIQLNSFVYPFDYTKSLRFLSLVFEISQVQGNSFEGNVFEGNVFEGNVFEGNVFEGNDISSL